MKKIFTLLASFYLTVSLAQDGAPATPYYDSFNFEQSGTALKQALANKIISTHINELTYTPGLWNALRNTDLDPENDDLVLLVYGFSDGICPSDGSNDDTHRRRNKYSNGGSNYCEWNREHIFPQSLGNPELGSSGPGADAHHLRACDVDRNGDRGNKKYNIGSGNSGDSGNGWYPGDEWKGDVARILMYMYLHYGEQCLPTYATMGNTVESDNNMPLILLQWNAEDPVSEYEDNRNTYLENLNNEYAQGNRNPFIDNPYLATLIWGGPVAQDRWSVAGNKDISTLELAIVPNPALNNQINIYSEKVLKEINLININGQLIKQIINPEPQNNVYVISNLPQGFYIVKARSDDKTTAEKVIVQ